MITLNDITYQFLIEKKSKEFFNQLKEYVLKYKWFKFPYRNSIEYNPIFCRIMIIGDNHIDIDTEILGFKYQINEIDEAIEHFIDMCFTVKNIEAVRTVYSKINNKDLFFDITVEKVNDFIYYLKKLNRQEKIYSIIDVDR